MVSATERAKEAVKVPVRVAPKAPMKVPQTEAKKAADWDTTWEPDNNHN